MERTVPSESKGLEREEEEEVEQWEFESLSGSSSSDSSTEGSQDWEATGINSISKHAELEHLHSNSSSENASEGQNPSFDESYRAEIRRTTRKQRTPHRRDTLASTNNNTSSQNQNLEKTPSRKRRKKNKDPKILQSMGPSSINSGPPISNSPLESTYGNEGQSLSTDYVPQDLEMAYSVEALLLKSPERSQGESLLDNDSDAIWRRTRARNPLTSVDIEDLEAQLKDDSMDPSFDDDDAYQAFLSAFSSGVQGMAESHLLPEEEEDDRDFMLDFDALLAGEEDDSFLPSCPTSPLQTRFGRMGRPLREISEIGEPQNIGPQIQSQILGEPTPVGHGILQSGANQIQGDSNERKQVDALGQSLIGFPGQNSKNSWHHQQSQHFHHSRSSTENPRMSQQKFQMQNPTLIGPSLVAAKGSRERASHGQANHVGDEKSKNLMHYLPSNTHPPLDHDQGTNFTAAQCQHAGSGIPVTIHPQMLAAMRQNPTFAVPYLHSPYAQAVPLGYVPGNLDPHLNKQILHQGATWTKSPDNERPKYKRGPYKKRKSRVPPDQDLADLLEKDPDAWPDHENQDALQANSEPHKLEVIASPQKGAPSKKPRKEKTVRKTWAAVREQQRRGIT